MRRIDFPISVICYAKYLTDLNNIQVVFGWVHAMQHKEIAG